ncbi:NADH-quinone oxidoreductase subunit A, partial [Nonomuraea sp. MG754425]|nr:NADH-quinone oxidoreductase subunit A [Nonomuraea sp. MG754425]
MDGYFESYALVAALIALGVAIVAGALLANR